MLNAETKSLLTPLGSWNPATSRHNTGKCFSEQFYWTKKSLKHSEGFPKGTAQPDNPAVKLQSTSPTNEIRASNGMVNVLLLNMADNKSQHFFLEHTGIGKVLGWEALLEKQSDDHILQGEVIRKYPKPNCTKSSNLSPLLGYAKINIKRASWKKKMEMVASWEGRMGKNCQENYETLYE